MVSSPCVTVASFSNPQQPTPSSPSPCHSNKQRIMTDIAQRLQEGWKLTCDICPVPGCKTPLVASPLSDGQRLFCVACQAPVLREGETLPPPLSVAAAAAAAAAAATSPVPSSPPPPSVVVPPTSAVSENPAVVTPTCTTPTTATSSSSSSGSFLPPSLTTTTTPDTDAAIAVAAAARAVQARRDAASSLMGRRMLSGWTMRAESCPDCHVPLMSQGGREGGGGWECVACEGKFGPDEPKEEGVVEEKEEKEEGREEDVVQKKDVSAEIGQRLLQGWALLAEACVECAIPLMRDREGKNRCLGCGGGQEQQQQQQLWSRGGQEGVEEEEEEEEADDEEEDEEAAAVQAALITAASRVTSSSLPSSSSSSSSSFPSSKVVPGALEAIYQRVNILINALEMTPVGGYEDTARIAMALTRLGEAAEVMERCVRQQQQQHQHHQQENGKVPPKRSRVG